MRYSQSGDATQEALDALAELYGIAAAYAPRAERAEIEAAHDTVCAVLIALKVQRMKQSMIGKRWQTQRRFKKTDDTLLNSWGQ